MMGATILHRGVKLDNHVHIGHGCEIGEFSRFAAQVGIAGSAKGGRGWQVGGQSRCADEAKIGDRVMVAAKAGIQNDLDDDVVVGGSPAVEIRQWRRYSAVITRLPEL